VNVPKEASLRLSDSLRLVISPVTEGLCYGMLFWGSTPSTNLGGYSTLLLSSVAFD
jgi:hypothetical protein